MRIYLCTRNIENMFILQGKFTARKQKNGTGKSRNTGSDCKMREAKMNWGLGVETSEMKTLKSSLK